MCWRQLLCCLSPEFTESFLVSPEHAKVWLVLAAAASVPLAAINILASLRGLPLDRFRQWPPLQQNQILSVFVISEGLSAVPAFIHCSVVRSSAVQHTQCSSECSAVQCNTVQCSAVYFLLLTLVSYVAVFSDVESQTLPV